MKEDINQEKKIKNKMEKLGKTYSLPTEKIKRNKSEVVWITVWLTLSVIWISFLVYLSITYGLDWSKDTAAIAFISNFPTFIFLSGFFVMFKTSEHIRTTEFLIHKYDRWNYNDSEYETLYIIERVDLFANFTYYKHTSDLLNRMSEKELQEHCESLPKTFDDFIGYKTQEEAMKGILMSVKELIKYDKREANIKVKNISTLEIFTIEELVEMIEEEDYVIIAENCPDDLWYSTFKGEKFKVKKNIEGFSHKNPNDCVWVTEGEHYGALIEKNHTVKKQL